MAAKPFRIIDPPTGLPSAEELARQYRLSEKDKAAIDEFVATVRSTRSRSVPAKVAKFRRRSGARKK